MPRKRKPLTEWQKQAKNFKARIRYSEKKGYRISEHARYAAEHIKEYTAEELKGFTHEYIREIDSISEKLNEFFGDETPNSLKNTLETKRKKLKRKEKITSAIYKLFS